MTITHILCWLSAADRVWDRVTDFVTFYIPPPVALFILQVGVTLDLFTFHISLTSSSAPAKTVLCFKTVMRGRKYPGLRSAVPYNVTPSRE